MQGMLFAKVLHMSLIGSYSITIVLLARLLLIRLGCGRKYAYYLWLAVFLNLCVPVSFTGIFSLIPRQMTAFSLEESWAGESGMSGQSQQAMNGVHVFSPAEAEAETAPEQTGDDMIWNGPADMLTEEKDGAGDETLSMGSHVQELKNLFGDPEMRDRILSGAEGIWLLGVLGLGIYHLAAAHRFSRELSKRAGAGGKKRGRIAEIEGIPTPFLWGLFHPVIYLPAGMETEEKIYIVSHENFHRRRKDYLVKPLIFAVTILHWFNPLAWLAYGLCCRDMEISCDEAVLEGSRRNIRKAYAESLLKYAARQNGYRMTPLTFGEPSLKSRIQNVLHYKKKSVILSAAALLCVLAVALGLLARPERSVEEIPEAPVSEEPETEEISGMEETSDEVVNNGGEIIEINGELYYMDGQPLYSDGKKLYTSIMDAGLSWAVYAYELDGSGYERLMDGRIVGWADEWNCPYVLTADSDTAVGSPETPGLYLLGELSWSPVAYTTDQFLDVDGEYAYFARETEDGFYVDRYWAGDGTVTENFIGTAVEAEQITDFHADGDYLLFAAGSVQGSGGYFDGDFYSYNRTPGRLFREHLTEAGAFGAADGFLYYTKISRPAGPGLGLYRVSYDLTGEELVGEDLTFLAYDESDGTLIAEKQTDLSSDAGSWYAGSLVRIDPDGSGEQALLDMEQMLKDSLLWEIENGDKIRFSEVNLLGDGISVRAEQWGYRDGTDVGYRDSLIQSAYLYMNRDGSDCRVWDPEQLRTDRENAENLNNGTVGTPCVPEEAGWYLADVTDVRRDFTSMSYVPEPGTEDDIFLLGQTEKYILYGKGDFESMLLGFGGAYAEISYPYGSNYMILPDLMEFDYDGDGAEELAITFNVKHGTGVWIDTFFMADQAADGSLYVYQFLEEDFLGQFRPHLTYEQTEEGLQAYADGQPAGSAMAEDEELGAYEQVSLGNQIRFYYGDCRIFIGANLDFWSAESAIAGYNDYQIRAEVSYGDAGQFQLNNYEIRNYMLEDTVRSALEEDYMRRDPDEKDTYIRIDEIRYQLSELENDTIEVEAVILPVGAESYDYALMELSRTDTGWKVESILYEK